LVARKNVPSLKYNVQNIFFHNIEKAYIGCKEKCAISGKMCQNTMFKIYFSTILKKHTLVARKNVPSLKYNVQNIFFHNIEKGQFLYQE
jgi:hypothetical protein